MTQIIKVSMDELDRNHARIAVNKFLDKNGMYSHLGINILMIPEFMGWEVYYKDFKNGTFASSEKVDGKLTFYISEKVWTRKSALALCYMIAAEYYEKDYVNFALNNYEDAFENIFSGENYSLAELKALEHLTAEEKKLMVEIHLKNNSDYQIELNEDFDKANSPIEKKYLYFAEDLLNRDHTLKFKQTQEPKQEF